MADFIFGCSKITADGDCSHEIKRCLLLGRKVMTNLDSILKSRDITLSAKVRLVKAMVFPVAMYGCESWTIKKADFFGRNDAKAETPVLWPPHVKSWLIGKVSDTGRDWEQEEKGMTEDEMAGWHHWLDGHESEWTPGVGDGLEGLACCDSWGHKESDTPERLNWTQLIYSFPLVRYSCPLSAGVLKALLCLKVYSWCIHGDVLHAHLFLCHLVLSGEWPFGAQALSGCWRLTETCALLAFIKVRIPPPLCLARQEQCQSANKVLTVRPFIHWKDGTVKELIPGFSHFPLFCLFVCFSSQTHRSEELLAGSLWCVLACRPLEALHHSLWPRLPVSESWLCPPRELQAGD